MLPQRCLSYVGHCGHLPLLLGDGHLGPVFRDIFFTEMEPFGAFRLLAKPHAVTQGFVLHLHVFRSNKVIWSVN